MARKRLRISAAEQAALRVIALGPQVKQSAWEAAQAFVARCRAERRGDITPQLCAVERRQVSA